MAKLGVEINGYSFLEKLGEGTFGKVWKVSKAGQFFAIKSIDLSKPGAEKTAEMEEYFSNQIRLRCPFIVDYIDSFRKGDDLYIVMEYCNGGDLDKYIANLDYRYGAALPENKLMKIVIQLVLGLAILHKNYIMHRDIKAGNALFAIDDELKIGDVGCGKIFENTLDQGETTVGTRHYVAPEIYRGCKYGYSADVWSLGVLFYYLCTGRLPFLHKNVFQLGDVVKDGKFQEIPNENCPTEMKEIINSILLRNKNPDDRPTAVAILRHPFIQKWAVELDLKKFFPAEAKDPLDAHEFLVAPENPSSQTSSTSSETVSASDTPAVNNAVQLFVAALLRDSPTCTPEQFRREFASANGRQANLDENTYFRMAKRAAEEKKLQEEEEERRRRREEEAEKKKASREREAEEKARKQKKKEEDARRVEEEKAQKRKRKETSSTCSLSCCFLKGCSCSACCNCSCLPPLARRFMRRCLCRNKFVVSWWAYLLVGLYPLVVSIVWRNWLKSPFDGLSGMMVALAVLYLAFGLILVLLFQFVVCKNECRNTYVLFVIFVTSVSFTGMTVILAFMNHAQSGYTTAAFKLYFDDYAAAAAAEQSLPRLDTGVMIVDMGVQGKGMA